MSDIYINTELVYFKCMLMYTQEIIIHIYLIWIISVVSRATKFLWVGHMM